MNQVHATIEQITPAFAAEVLAKKAHNRAVSKNTVDAYSGAIKRGEWRMNGEPIIFDADGNLSDGQHRLHAVVRAKKAIDVLVVRGVSPDSFATLDTGKKRSDRDVLSIHGHKNPFVLAAAARAIVRIDGGTGQRNLVTTPLLMATIAAHPSITDWTALFVGSAAQKFMTSGYVGVLVLAAERHGIDKVANFHEQVSRGIGLLESSPAHHLREKFISGVFRNASAKDAALIYCIKAMNAHLQGLPVKHLRAGARDEFPAIL